MSKPTRILGPDEIEVIRGKHRRLGQVLGMTLASIAGVILVAVALDRIHGEPGGVLSWLMVAAAGSAVAGYLWLYVFLIDLPRRIGSSAIVWAGLAFITAPLGPLVAAGLLRGRVGNALTTGEVSQ